MLEYGILAAEDADHLRLTSATVASASEWSPRENWFLHGVPPVNLQASSMCKNCARSHSLTICGPSVTCSYAKFYRASGQ